MQSAESSSTQLQVNLAFTLCRYCWMPTSFCFQLSIRIIIKSVNSIGLEIVLGILHWSSKTQERKTALPVQTTKPFTMTEQSRQSSSWKSCHLKTTTTTKVSSSGRKLQPTVQTWLQTKVTCAQMHRGNCKALPAAASTLLCTEILCVSKGACTDRTHNTLNSFSKFFGSQSR